MWAEASINTVSLTYNGVDIRTFWSYASCLRRYTTKMAPNCYRKEYPEASFSAVGAIATGMMGIRPQRAESDGVVIAGMGRVSTRAALAGIDWVELDHVPLLGGEVSVRHDGGERTLFMRETGAGLTWRAEFAGECGILINGEPAAANTVTDEFSGDSYTYADIDVQPGVEIKAERV